MLRILASCCWVRLSSSKPVCTWLDVAVITLPIQVLVTVFTLLEPRKVWLLEHRQRKDALWLAVTYSECSWEKTCQPHSKGMKNDSNRKKTCRLRGWLRGCWAAPTKVWKMFPSVQMKQISEKMQKRCSSLTIFPVRWDVICSSNISSDRKKIFPRELTILNKSLCSLTLI